MVGRPPGPGVNTMVVIGVGVGVVEISWPIMMISLPVVLRNMTETMTRPGVTLISKHKFEN